MPYVIYGDVHGCLEEWIELRKHIPKNSVEISVGDLIDKGPYSAETIEYARKNKILSILGNHEYKHLRKHLGRNVILDEDQLQVYPKLKIEDFEYIKNMPLFIKLNRLLIVHAGITNKISLNSPFKTLTQLLYLRDVDKEENFLPIDHTIKDAKHWSEIYRGKEGYVIYGHQPFIDVKKNYHSLGIDTGCVYGRKLTAVIIYDTFKPFRHKIIQVRAKKQYAKPNLPIKII